MEQQIIKTCSKNDVEKSNDSRAKRGIWIWCASTTTTMEEPWETVFWRSEGGPVTQWVGLGDSCLALGGEGP